MNKWVTALLLSLFPVLVFAAEGSSLSFAPPASDYSVIFLGNLFGIVDGVLRGSGSQIMGVMFGVFNSAVLALGGIIIMYTLMVSTMNTAHEGQMLGQKWSSIWIPVRSTMGLALLIPKASGYCLMQIFVMWIVVQGVGAADKIWEAALGYLNRGGVIIQAQANPTITLTQSATSGVAGGAQIILTGQVCMLGLQKQLQTQRQNYLNAKESNAGPCFGNPTGIMNTFCNTAVPDFISTVNAVTIQNNADSSARARKANSMPASYSVGMPNFSKSSPYSVLNGICGTLNWNSIGPLSNITATTGQNASVGGVNNITSSQLETAQMSRAIAVQQMYMDLASVAQIIINNAPTFSTINNSNSGNSPNKNFSSAAIQQFGVPYTANGTICTNYKDNCVIWGPLATTSGSASGALFSGSEFQGAIADYNSIMRPTLNLIKARLDAKSANDARKFIAQANAQGWIMAGSYFFDLVKLNGNAVTNADTNDANTGLDNSSFNMTNLATPCKLYPILCTWFQTNSSTIPQIAAVQTIIDGTNLTPRQQATPRPDLKPNPQRSLIGALPSSTVYGFINNSVMVQLPGQPGLQPLQFANLISFSVDTQMYYLEEQEFDCGRVKIGFFSFCLGRMLGNLFYNLLLRNIYNFFLTIFQQIINQVIMAFLMIPLQGMADIFKKGMQTINQPGVNPIVALANMGSMYINFSANLWMMLLNIAVVSALIPIFGIFIFALIALAMPLLMAWIGIMVGVGFTTAYYVPILPYLIFTLGTIAWLISVIEAMVAAPIVALGITHPEGHDAFGKGEAAIMILMNVFLRPAMMIIGYISAIALSYVGVWVLNAGFDNAIGFIQGGNVRDTSGSSIGGFKFEGFNTTNTLSERPRGSGSGGYTEWAGIYAYFFSILIYTTTYLIIVQKAFTLISYLPDKVLRWIGGSPESLGQESAQWGDQVKSATEGAGKETQNAQGQIDKQLGGYGQKAVGSLQSGASSAAGGGGDISSEGANPTSTPSSPDGGGGGGGDDDSDKKAKDLAMQAALM
ncbi:MAG: type IVB secretion system protein DotA [Legionella sp.]|nr:type IVB secretion system protein DotA [Legionella sp.]